MSTSRPAPASPRSRRSWRASRGSSGCWIRTASARSGSTIRARASWSRSRRPDRWFSYYYWLDDARAPDFARTVDIHRKPGYDPVELFVDPAIRLPPLAIGWRLAKRRLGQRTLLDVISLKDTRLVKGSHGRITDDPDHGPLVISSAPELLPEGLIQATAFKDLVLDHVFGREARLRP